MTNAKQSSKPGNGNKFFDVIRPGKIAPPASSKSIIVPQRPIMQDPMMVDKADGHNAGFEPDSAHQPSSKVKLAPLTNIPKNSLKIFRKNKPKSTIADYKTADLVKVDQVIVDPEPPALQASDEAAQTTEVEKDETQASNPDSSEVVAEPSAAQDGPSENNEEEPAKSNAEQQAEEEAARQELERQTELQNIINGHQYYLPINTVEKRRTKHKLWLIMAIVIIIAVVWLDLVLDAGIIQFHGLHPLTHFFSS